jgi:hypothetical protein
VRESNPQHLDFSDNPSIHFSHLYPVTLSALPFLYPLTFCYALPLNQYTYLNGSPLGCCMYTRWPLESVACTPDGPFGVLHVHNLKPLVYCMHTAAILEWLLLGVSCSPAQAEEIHTTTRKSLVLLAPESLQVLHAKQDSASTSALLSFVFLVVLPLAQLIQSACGCMPTRKRCQSS